jgi:hypothetical protein
MRTKAMAAVLAAGALLAGCGQQQPVRVAAELPSRILPSTLNGLDTKQEPSAARAFGSAGKSSLTARGVVWTLREDGQVRGALQVGVLKPGHDTTDIDVRRGVRATIETGQYRWFKLEGQWVGVQDLAELTLYLWFPPRGDIYEILQVQPGLEGKKDVLASILRYQKESA